MSQQPDPTEDLSLGPFDLSGFLGALNAATPSDHEDVKVFLNTAYEDTALQQPSPQAAPFHESGEWDDAKDLGLVRITEEELDSLCRASMGSKGCFCLNASLAPGGTCSVGSHQHQMEVRPGWYIERSVAGSPRSGGRLAFFQPHMPLSLVFDQPGIASSLLDTVRPFRMSLGQWKFIFQQICRALLRQARAQEDTNPPIPSSADLDVDTVLIQADTLSALLQGVNQGGGDDETAPPPRQDSDDLTREREANERRFQLLERQVQDLRSTLTARDKVISELKASNVKHAQLSTKMLDIAKTLQRQSATSAAGAAPASLPADQRDYIRKLSGRVNALEQVVSSPNGTIAAFRLSLKNLEDKLIHGGVEFLTWHWSSAREFKSWYLNLAGTPEAASFGLFFDSFVSFHGLSPGTVTMRESLAQEQAIKKVEYKSDLEARSGTSFATNFPDIFGSSGDRDEFGKSITSYEMWKDNSSPNGSFATTIRDALRDDEQSVRHTIEQSVTDPELRRLASTMLDKANAWCLAFMQFAEEFYMEMSLAPSMTGQEAWGLTKNMMGEVLREVRTARNVVKSTVQTDRTMHIWGCLRGQVVMQEFQTKFFRNHPALTGIQTRFLVKRKVDLDGLSKVNKQIKDLNTKVGALSQDQKTLENKLKLKADK